MMLLINDLSSTGYTKSKHMPSRVRNRIHVTGPGIFCAYQRQADGSPDEGRQAVIRGRGRLFPDCALLHPGYDAGTQQDSSATKLCACCAAGLVHFQLVEYRYYGHGIHGRTRKSFWKLFYLSVFFRGFRGYSEIPAHGLTCQHPFASS
jgi:hypothetical protein